MQSGPLTPTSANERPNRLVGKRFKTRLRQPTPIKSSESKKVSSRSSTHNRFGFRLTDESGKPRDNIIKEL